MEADVFVELDAKKRQFEELFYYSGQNNKICAIIASNDMEYPISIFEVSDVSKVTSNDFHDKDCLIFSDELEKIISETFPNNNIENRYFIYPGQKNILIDSQKNRTYLLVGIDAYLKNYWNFVQNRELIAAENSQISSLE